jgi:hypothetical protein
MAISVNLLAYSANGGAPLTYSAGTTYVNGDVVVSGGTKFKCKATSTGNTPATGTNTFWVEIVERTIGGATRDYQTVAAWITACPNLTTTNQIWKGLIYKEGNGATEWAESINLGLKTGGTDANRFLWLEPASGQGFLDNANKLTNALRYNNANGVALAVTGNNSVYGGNNVGYAFVRGLQLKGVFSTSGAGTFLNAWQCIVLSPSLSERFALDFGGLHMTNCVLHTNLTSNYVFWARGNSFSLNNCTFYNNGTAVDFANGSSGNLTIKNSTIFGYSLNAGSSGAFVAAASTYNITDLAAFSWSATGNIVSAVAADQFTSLTVGSEDFRVKAGSGLVAGTRDQTNTNDLDIVGSARLLTTPTIGAWEFPSVTYTYARPSSDITTQWSTSSGSTHYTLIDETVADDNDYIVATAAGQTDEVKLASMTPPQVGTNLVINYKVTGVDGGATVTVSLRQGSAGTLIKADTTRNANGTYALAVAPGDWAAVTDWSDLRLRFVSA